MSGLIPDAVKRRISAVVLAVALLPLLLAFFLVALGAFASALYYHWLPTHGPEVAWWISGAIFLCIALVIGAVLWWRLRSAGTKPAHSEQPAETAPDMAMQLAGLLRNELPRNAVPATVLALVAGVAVGLNPQAVRAVIDSVTRKPG
jgi:hypothetical protein